MKNLLPNERQATVIATKETVIVYRSSLRAKKWILSSDLKTEFHQDELIFGKQ